MAHPADGNRRELRRIVLDAEAGGSEKQPQDLRVGPGGPAGHKIEQEKHQEATQKTREKIERAGADARGENEQLSLGPLNRERARERAMDEMDAFRGAHGL